MFYIKLINIYINITLISNDYKLLIKLMSINLIEEEIK
jgi:hypothetical protein